MTTLIPLPKEIAEDAEKKCEMFFSAARSSGISLPENLSFLQTLKSVFAFSDFVAGGAARHPKVFFDLIETGDLERSYKDNEYPDKLKKIFPGPGRPEDEDRLSRLLRDFRFRELLRIAWRDLAAQADLEETMTDLSALADACLDHALMCLYDWQCTRWGTPFDKDGVRQYLVVISMGKLGGRELNFSSDVDLIFSYPRAGETKDGPKNISNEEFFTRLCRSLIRVISATTSNGFVFRVDMRLRPYGESGPIVTNFDAMEAYYQYQGREWERYSWIKARASAGDKSAGKELILRLRPFVYRKYLDYGTFESLRDMKQKIALEVAGKRMKENIKLGPGGIREIEFFGQIFQLVRGGVTPVFQESRILKTLSVLAQEKCITTDVRDNLAAAYNFLRITEHRLQEFDDQQIHSLPSDSVERLRLALSMGFTTWEEFEIRLTQHMMAVHNQFEMLLNVNGQETVGAQDEKTVKDLLDVWETLGGHEKGGKILSDAGFEDPTKVMDILRDLKQDPATLSLSSNGLNRLDRLIPLVLKHVGTADHPDMVLNRIIDLIRTIERRTNYLSLLVENPAVLAHLVKLAAAGSWIISFLARHPVLLDEFLDPRTLYSPPDRADMEREMGKKVDQSPTDDLESQIIALSIFKQVNTLRVAAADITGVLPLMKVSDHLTDIGEIVLKNVLDLSWKYLTARHGTPECLLDGEACDLGFCIIAYGKLGGIELGYGSDLDLVFLHSGTKDQTRGGKYPIDNSHFFSRLGQRVVHTLTAVTPAGVLYDCDMRLRPDGSSGILVVHMEAFKEYQMEKAWVWEHQALIKARGICGDPELKTYFEEIRRDTLALPRDGKSLQEEVGRMRSRMRKELLDPETDVFDIKQGIGGLVDIEFVVQYLVLRNAHQYPRLTQWTDVVRLLQTLDETGVITSTASASLKDAYLAYRSAIHKFSLREEPAKVPDSHFLDIRKNVTEIWEDLFEDRT